MDSPPTKMEPPPHPSSKGDDSDQPMESEVTDDNQPLRRPMNAFLLFCKRHRRVVKSQHPWLDNRSCTKMLADMWAVLDSEEKNKYLQLARECKAAFMKAHPGYKWCGSSKQNVKPTSPTVTTRTKFPMMSSPSEHGPEVRLAGHSKTSRSHMGITVGKLADPSDMGGLSLLLLAGQQAMGKPPSPPSSDTLSTEGATEEASSDTKSALFEFAEMCSSRQLIECESDSNKPSTTTPPSTPILPAKEPNRTNKKDTSPDLNVKSEPADAMDIANNNEPVKLGSPRKVMTKEKKSHKRNKKRSKSDKKKKKGSRKSKGESKCDATSVKVEDVVGNRVLESKSEVVIREELKEEDNDIDDNKNSSASYDDKDGEPESPSGRRKSSRSCKGRLYREMVMGGMLESLQRPERPFNCKKPWRHGDSTCYSDGDDAVFEPEPEKPKRPSRRKSRKRTLSGCGMSLPADFDYGEIDVEARLATLPQYSPDQFQPRGKCHRAKRSSSLYKNSTFVRKDGHRADGGRLSIPTSPSQYFQHSPLTGSQKRKARKSSIMHLTPSQADEKINSIKIEDNSKKQIPDTYSQQPKSTRVRLEFNTPVFDKNGKSVVTTVTKPRANNNSSSGSSVYSSSSCSSSSSSQQTSNCSSVVLASREPRSASQKPCSSSRTTSTSAALNIGMQTTLTVP